MRREVPVAAVQRIARLLLMIGFAVAAFIALSSFDQAARADDGLTDRLGKTDPPASVEKLASDAGTDRAAPRLTERKGSAAQAEKGSTSRGAGRKAVPLKVERRTAVAPKPQGRKAEVPRVRERKADGGRVSTSRVEVRKASVLRADAARASARHMAILTEPREDLRLTAEREAFAAGLLAAVP